MSASPKPETTLEIALPAILGISRSRLKKLRAMIPTDQWTKDSGMIAYTPAGIASIRRLAGLENVPRGTFATPGAPEVEKTPPQPAVQSSNPPAESPAVQPSTTNGDPSQLAHAPEKTAPTSELLTVHSRPIYPGIDPRTGQRLPSHFRNRRLIEATKEDGTVVRCRVVDSGRFTTHLRNGKPMQFYATPLQDGTYVYSNREPRWLGCW